jgi:DNA-directed RNA polymerase subunit RPC12/RpoP
MCYDLGDVPQGIAGSEMEVLHVNKGEFQMTWGPYWMFYKCNKCKKKYKYSLEDIQSPRFGKCPTCKEEGKLVAESKDAPADAPDYEEVSL